MSQHDHTPEQERKIREAALDQTIADSFPASDPPSTIPNPDDEDAVRQPQERAPAPSDGEFERKRRSVDG